MGLGLPNKPMFLSLILLCRFYFRYPLSKTKLNKVPMITKYQVLSSGLLKFIKRSSTPEITSACVQNLGLSNYVFGSQHDAHKFLIHILCKFFLDIDQSIFQNKVIESTICEDTNNPESGCGSSCSLKEVISQVIRLDVEDTHEL